MHWHHPDTPKEERLHYLKDNVETILAGAIDPTVLECRDYQRII